MSADIIDQIKRLVPLGSLLNTQKKRITCPLPDHKDKNPSCDVDHNAGVWHCKVCDLGGTVFDLLMLRDRLSFADALKQLADIAGVSLATANSQEAQERWEKKKRIEAAMAYASNYYHQALLKHKGGLAYLESRGIDLETIKRMQLGWSDGNLTRSVKAANLAAISLDDFIEAGLIRKHDQRQGSHYDFFDARIIFPLLYRGRVLNLSARKTDLSQNQAKYLHLAAVDVDNFYNEEAIGREVWLFEGHPDTVIGVQVGLPAVGIIGTSGLKHPEKLAACDKIYICGDTDGPGKSAVDKWASLILAKNPSCEVLCVTLPAETKDFNEWYLTARGKGFGEKFDALKDGAKGIIDYRISNLESTDQLAKVWPLLHALPEIQQAGYLQKIKRQLNGVSLQLLRKELKNWSLDLVSRTTASDIAVSAFSFKPKKVNTLNIGFHLGEHPEAHVCLYADVSRVIEGQEQTQFEPVLIRSTITDSGYKADIVPVCDSELSGETRTLPSVSVVSGRWSEAGIMRFRAGNAEESTAALVRDLSNYFKRYIWHREPVTFEVFALFAMGTYAARLFGSFPYLALNGLAGSGKTNILELFERLCFNSLLAVNISPAALYRSIEMNCPTCLRDEAEQFNKRTEDNQDELTILNSGYKQGAKVSRIEKDKNGNMTLGEFEVFSPKIFAGINMLNDVLLTRSILVKTHKAPKEVIAGMPPMNQHRARWEAEGNALRDRLYIWALTKFHQVKEVYQNYPAIGEIVNRDWEVWLPLLTIAGLADMEAGDELIADETLTERITTYAIGKSKERKEMAKDNAVEMKVLDTILRLMDEFEITCVFGHPNWFVISTVAKAISTRLQEEGFLKENKGMTPRWLSGILDNAQVISDRAVQVKDIKDVNKTKRCVYMPREAIEKALANL